MDATSTDTQAQVPVERWVCLEIFGHRSHYGRLTSSQLLGAAGPGEPEPMDDREPGLDESANIY